MHKIISEKEKEVKKLKAEMEELQKKEAAEAKAAEEKAKAAEEKALKAEYMKGYDAWKEARLNTETAPKPKKTAFSTCWGDEDV